jgi:hypothetical protein
MSESELILLFLFDILQRTFLGLDTLPTSPIIYLLKQSNEACKECHFMYYYYYYLWGGTESLGM